MNIKFRVWDKLNEIMSYSFQYGSLGSEGAETLRAFFAEYEVRADDTQSSVMQYTGMNDIEGKEIYEGDIVKSPKHGFDLVEEVKLERFLYDKTEWSYTCNNVRVVGNIHENPELLRRHAHVDS